MAWWHQALLIATASVLFIYSAGYLLGARVLGPLVGWGEGVPPNLPVSPADLSALFARWDSGYYLSIAQNGYAPGGDERAFYPLYPLAVRMLSDLTGVPLLLGGLVISILAFTISGLLIYEWARSDYSHDQALWATILMYTSPMAFFFVAFYGEPLLLLASVATLLFVRRGQYVPAGLAIALAGAARPTAFLLAIPYIVEFVIQRDFRLRTVASFVVGMLLAPLGVVAYVLGLYLNTGYLPVVNEMTWKTYYTWPWAVFADGVKAAVLGVGIRHDWFSVFLVWHDLLWAVLGLVLSLLALRWMRPSAALFLLVGMLFLTSVHGPDGYAFWSISRRIVVLVPVYVVGGLLLSRLPVRLRVIVVSLSAISLGLLSAWFVTGRWVA